MNITYYFIITLLIAITQSCHTMKNIKKEQSHIISTINTMTNPQDIISFEKNIAVMASNQECSIYNIVNNKKIHTLLTNTYIKKIVGHPYKPLLAILTYHTSEDKRSLIIYNIKTYYKIAEFAKKTINQINTNKRLGTPFAFNPINDTILIKYGPDRVCIFNYETQEEKSHKLDYILPDTYSWGMTWNPHKNEFLLCAIKKRNNPLQETSVITMSISDEKITCNELFLLNNINNLDALYCNKKGSKILLIRNLQYIIQLINNHQKSSVNNNMKSCNAIAQGSNDIFVTLSIPNKCFYYWDIYNNKNPIASTPIECNKLPPPQLYVPAILSFTRANQQLLAHIDGKLQVLQVPFEALYKKTKKECLFIHFILYHYRHEKVLLIKDIRSIIMQYFLNLHTYNY